MVYLYIIFYFNKYIILLTINLWNIKISLLRIKIYTMDSDKKFILKIFDKNRFTLRPSSLNKIINFLKDRQE